MSDAAAPSLRQLSLYFLRLGALGFGGPVALANAMRKDLVEILRRDGIEETGVQWRLQPGRAA